MRGVVKIVNIVNIANIASPANLLCTIFILFYHEASLRREQRLRDGEDWGDLWFSGFFGVFIHICCSIFRVNLLLWQITIWKGWAAMPMVVWWVTDLSRGPQPPPATAGPDPAKPGPTRELSGHLHYKIGPGSTTPARSWQDLAPLTAQAYHHSNRSPHTQSYFSLPQTWNLSKVALVEFLKINAKNIPICDICRILAWVCTKQLEWVCIWVDNCTETNNL